ncbi:MAG: FmdB family zinc ribbon protein [Syntrophales bacterium]
MPIYEYKCGKCGKEFEVFQGVADPELRTCKFCQGPIRKLISLSTFHLKGSGWYVTDYGGKKAPTGEREKSESASDSPAGQSPANSESAGKTGD